MNRGKPKKAQLRKMLILKQEIGCIACLKLGYFREADFHHGNNPPLGVDGHDWGFPACLWHHRGMGEPVFDTPSIARDKKGFHERFGSEADLVQEANSRYENFESMVVGGSR